MTQSNGHHTDLKDQNGSTGFCLFDLALLHSLRLYVTSQLSVVVLNKQVGLLLATRSKRVVHWGKLSLQLGVLQDTSSPRRQPPFARGGVEAPQPGSVSAASGVSLVLSGLLGWRWVDSWETTWYFSCFRLTPLLVASIASGISGFTSKSTQPLWNLCPALFVGRLFQIWNRHMSTDLFSVRSKRAFIFWILPPLGTESVGVLLQRRVLDQGGIGRLLLSKGLPGCLFSRESSFEHGLFPLIRDAGRKKLCRGGPKAHISPARG